MHLRRLDHLSMSWKIRRFTTLVKNLDDWHHKKMFYFILFLFLSDCWVHPLVGRFSIANRRLWILWTAKLRYFLVSHSWVANACLQFLQIRVFSLFFFFSFLLLDKIKLKQTDMGSNKKYPSVWINSKSCAGFFRYRISDQCLANVWLACVVPKVFFVCCWNSFIGRRKYLHQCDGLFICVSFLLLWSSMVLPVVSLVAWRKVIILRKASILPQNCSWSIACVSEEGAEL